VSARPAPFVSSPSNPKAADSHRPAGGLAADQPHHERHPRVLVIDDEPIWRSTLARVLRSLGAEVVLAQDGREGLRKLTDALFDIDFVVLDLHMPHIDGRGVLDRVRRLGKETGLRLFLFSAASREELESVAAQAFATAIFSKLDPIDSLTLRLAVELDRPVARGAARASDD
jgi:CheY-like chemotaxis protein